MSIATVARRAHAAAPIPEAALAAFVAGIATTPELWSPFVPAVGAARSSVHLLETDALDVWLLGWPPGTHVEPHDHGDSAGAFVVVRGSLVEVRWSGTQRRRVVAAGEVISVAPGVVHDVLAGDAAEVTPAVSLHAYSPPLRTMGFYSDDGRRRIAQVAIDPEPTVL